MLSDFVKYVKQYWHDRPDKSTPLNADRLNHIENGIGSNSEAINQIANAVVSNIVNDPDKIASIAAVYALQEKLGTGELPSDASDAISAINTLYSNLDNRIGVGEKFTSGTLLSIIRQMSNGIHMALVSKTVSDIPFSDIENYIIVFKGTSYGDPYTRIMAFPMSQSSAPKWGMVFWDSSRIVWG